ncbi:spindle and kinetochore-associated protein 3 isoform X2 [Hyla sarda]|uniref:spindle and kinetochore-associated protein 3 isoform X2 n=1 Tax=Hyla sarda TaxID=327740 RepID=UPI0024C260E1|nr:spindle and kinetochore-associated protein 3 isoform X2 [Hyla sarda]
MLGGQRPLWSREQGIRMRMKPIVIMSVTGNFFSKLRHLALTLEKETAHLEQVFTQEDDDYEEESPMRVLHDLRSEVMSVKTDIQTTLEKNEKKGQDLNNFLKICKVLQQKNASDIQQIRDTFQNYGYKRLESETQENDKAAEEAKLESAEEDKESSDPQGPPPPPVTDKLKAWDFLRGPQLSDFGLSHYQMPAMWEPQAYKKAPEEKPKPLYKDIRTITVPKTPKYALCREEDFSQIQHFGISDYSANLNDDYTIALINKKKASGPEKPKDSSRDFKHLLATPSHLTYRNDCVDSPLPPVFCTPGLKVHKKGSFDVKDEKCNGDDTDDATSSRDMRSDVCQSLRSNTVDSPLPPTFCTPGLKVQKKDLSCAHPEPSESKAPPVVKALDTPPVPSFETKWLKSDTIRTLDITEPIIPRPDLSYSLDLKVAAPPVLQSDKYFEKPTKTSSPPKMRDFCIGTPPRPEMTSCLTEDLFKHNLKLASPPKVSQYENELWTPNRPEMTSCITEDISQILSRYCENPPKPSWQNASENKENRLFITYLGPWRSSCPLQ